MKRRAKHFPPCDYYSEAVEQALSLHIREQEPDDRGVLTWPGLLKPQTTTCNRPRASPGFARPGSINPTPQHKMDGVYHSALHSASHLTSHGGGRLSLKIINHATMHRRTVTTSFLRTDSPCVSGCGPASHAESHRWHGLVEKSASPATSV